MSDQGRFPGQPYGQPGWQPYGPGPGPQAQGPYAPPPYGFVGYGPPPPTGPRNGFGAAAAICGVLGTLLGLMWFLFPLAGILGVVALVLGPVGMGRANRGEADNRGTAIAGTVLGLVACVLSVVGFVVVVHKVSDGVGHVSSYVQCVANIPSADPQRDARIADCGRRF